VREVGASRILELKGSLQHPRAATQLTIGIDIGREATGLIYRLWGKTLQLRAGVPVRCCRRNPMRLMLDEQLTLNRRRQTSTTEFHLLHAWACMPPEGPPQQQPRFKAGN
jgi:hypothetical protein